MPAPPPPATAGKAILNMVCAVALFGTMNAMVKWLSATYPLSQIVFCRSLFALVAIWPMVRAAGGLSSLRTDRPLGHAGRSLAGVTAMGCSFTAISLLPLPMAVALNFTTPFWITILGVLLLSERVRWRRTLALVFGFAGVMIMLRPDFSGPFDLSGADRIALGSTIGLSGAVFAAFAMISIRRLSATEPSTSIVFYFMTTACLISGALLPFQAVMPSLHDGIMLVVMGLIGGVAQLLLTRAYRGAPVAVIAPFDYTSMLWATGYGIVLWDEWPDRFVLLGALVVIASGVYITLREIKLGAPPTAKSTSDSH